MSGKQHSGNTLKGGTELNCVQNVFLIKPWSTTKELFPILSTKALNELKDSIEADGCKEPIKVLPDGRIIDGYHRWQILGEAVPYTIVNITDDEAIGLAMKLNYQRRELSKEQRDEFERKRRQIALDWLRKGKPQELVAKLLGVSQQLVSYWKSREDNATITNIGNTCEKAFDTILPLPDNRISIPKHHYQIIVDRLKNGESQEQVASDYDVTRQRISQIKELVEAKDPPKPIDGSIPYPTKKYRTLVIDPPWPIKVMGRECRPHQGQYMDYPTMTIEEIEKLPINELAQEAGCHVYLWFIHSQLLNAIHLFEVWNVRYQCILTWIKPSGFTPYSWMYNTEHLLFGRIGSLELLKRGVKLAFSAPVVRHSQKPDLFYELVSKVSPEPRLDMFARKNREGFDVWGNEVNGA